MSLVYLFVRLILITGHYSADTYTMFSPKDFDHMLNQQVPADMGDWINITVQITNSRVPAPAEPARH